MKLGKSITELAAELERQTAVKRDFLAPATSLLMHTTETDSRLQIDGVGVFGVQDTAHDQLAAKLDIPRAYYDRMRRNSRSLFDTNVNHWLQNGKEPEKYMVRTLDGNARALLSSKYRPLDNYDLAQVALPALVEAGCQIESCEITERKMYLKATTPKLQYEVKQGDVVQAGIVISNSEIGHGSLSIEPLLLRLICLNGMIVNDARMRRHHVGKGHDPFDQAQEYFRDETRLADDKAFWMKVRDAITHSFTEIAFAKYVEKFGEAKADRVTADPVAVVEMAQKRLNFNETEGRTILTHWLQSSDMDRFGFANAVTRTAQDATSYDRATELERLGGQIIELPKTDWNRIALN